MSYIRQTLGRDEQLRAEVRVHWGVYLPAMALGVAAVLLWIGGAGAFVTGKLSQSAGKDDALGLLLASWFPAAALTVAALGSAVKAWIYAITTEMAVTNKKVIAKWGLIARRTMEQRLSKVESIVVHQGIAGRIFRFGEVYVRGTGSSSTPIRYVADPVTFRQEVERAIEDFERGSPPSNSPE